MREYFFRAAAAAPGTIDKITAAALLGVSPRTIDRMRDAGQIDFVQIGRRVRFPRDAIRARFGV